MTTLPNKLVYLLNEFAVAEMLGISVATVRRWRLLRSGPKYVKIGAAVRYRLEDLTAWRNRAQLVGTTLHERQ
jgi:predicted DNA-binding transcriptional regulator AlpA